MSSTQSKRTVSMSNLSTEALTKEELDELQRILLSGKKLTRGRIYIKRKSKRRAEYWDCFMEYLEEQLYGPKLLRAECKFCDKTFAADSNVNGSKNIGQHWGKCIRNPANKGKGMQTEFFFEPGNVNMDGEEVEGKLKYGTVNLKDVRDALIYMIVVDELPFRHVEKDGFRHLMSVACPKFHIPSRTTVARDCLSLYLDEKQTLKEMFNKSCQRICVTTDTWTTIQRINYMCLTAHFIDNEWKLHKRIINFCPISSHKGDAIGKAVEACLEAWGIEDKLFTVTVDNASSNDVASTIQRFKELVQKLNIDCKLSLSLDVPTRWNSTYIMLETALKYQRVFGGLNLPDGDDFKFNELPPDADDWKKIASVLDMLNKWEKHGDDDFKAMTTSMKKKYEKYWGNVEKMNMMIYIAVILDPHSKLLVVELTLTNMYGKEKGMELANNVKAFAYSLFDEYRVMYSYLSPQSGPINDLTSLHQQDEDDVGGTMNYLKNLKDRAKRLKGSSDWLRARLTSCPMDIEEYTRDLEELQDEFDKVILEDEIVYVDS
ncbi:hypothetical protein RND81_11G049800 [Saponaria officinalis]|uniref:hAT-like transposase RNase-H fold domain-containing protein n=1 Tax=Saponaria officinalis TaxID=3572 RepID=A0AAW1HIA4_SAPOF